MILQDIIETFALTDDWEERYAALIDLGCAMPPMEESLKTDDVLVRGCTSRVWLIAERRKNADGAEVWHFTADSDAALVRGLVAVLLAACQDKTSGEIAALDIRGIFEQLGLAQNLSPSRRNGFFAMVERIRRLTD